MFVQFSLLMIFNVSDNFWECTVISKHWIGLENKTKPTLPIKLVETVLRTWNFTKLFTPSLANYDVRIWFRYCLWDMLLFVKKIFLSFQFVDHNVFAWSCEGKNLRNVSKGGPKTSHIILSQGSPHGTQPPSYNWVWKISFLIFLCDLIEKHIHLNVTT